MFRWPNSGRLDAIEFMLCALARKLENIVASLDEIRASQAAEDKDISSLVTASQAASAALANASAKLAALQAQQTISPADLDAIKSDMDAQKQSMDAALASAQPASGSAPAQQGTTSPTATPAPAADQSAAAPNPSTP